MEIISELERTRDAVLPYFGLSEPELERTYGPGKWSVRYVLHHLSDSETVHLYRIRRLISEPKQIIWATDQDAWANRLDYSTVPLDTAKALFVASREAIIHQARKHYEGSDQIRFVHSELGSRTLLDEFHKVVWHTDQHVRDIRTGLGTLFVAEVGPPPKP